MIQCLMSYQNAHSLLHWVLLVQIIASHIIKVHASADAVSADSKTSKEENWLKRYLAS